MRWRRTAVVGIAIVGMGSGACTAILGIERGIPPEDGGIDGSTGDGDPTIDSTGPPIDSGPDVQGCLDVLGNSENCGACGRSCQGGGCEAGGCTPVAIASGLTSAGPSQ